MADNSRHLRNDWTWWNARESLPRCRAQSLSRGANKANAQNGGANDYPEQPTNEGAEV